MALPHYLPSNEHLCVDNDDDGGGDDGGGGGWLWPCPAICLVAPCFDTHDDNVDCDIHMFTYWVVKWVCDCERDWE